MGLYVGSGAIIAEIQLSTGARDNGYRSLLRVAILDELLPVKSAFVSSLC